MLRLPSEDEELKYVDRGNEEVYEGRLDGIGCTVYLIVRLTQEFMAGGWL